MTALWFREWRWILLPAVVGALLSVAIIEIPSGPSKVTLLCDEAVHQLLTTKDPVELQRASFLVEWFDCNIRRRLP